MDSKRTAANEVSITRIALAYVVCLIAGGLAVLNIFLHANNAVAIAGCSVVAIAALAGIVYCTRMAMRTLVV